MNMITIFENKNNTIVISAKMLSKEIKKSISDVNKRIEDIVRELHNSNPDSAQKYFINDTFIGGNNRKYNEWFLTKEGFALYMFNIQGYNEFKRAYINEFNRMESELKSENTTPKQESVTEKNFVALAHISNIMGYNDSSKALQVNKLIGSLGLDSCLLIDYTKSNGNLLSATELIKRNNKSVSASAFNKLMIANGFLEQRTRPSTGGSVKQYKSLTDKGLEFGENQVSPVNPRETQPLYFDTKFLELCEQLGI